jgi:hypothetical protein
MLISTASAAGFYFKTRRTGGSLTSDIPIPEEIKLELKGLGVIALAGMQHRAEQGGDTLRAGWVKQYLETISRNCVWVKFVTPYNDPDCRWSN